MTVHRMMHRVLLLAIAGGLLAGLPLSSGAAALDVRVAPAAAPTPPPGLPPFYAVPDPLPPGNPGDVIALEQETVSGLHGTLYRVMYHSRSLLGKDIAVTGLIAVPATPAPAVGYQVISWAHGTTGIADVCAPSLDPSSYAGFANGLLDQGYLVTATDYEGLGTPGRHPYIVGESEARGVLDIVRAARNLPSLHASDRYLVWGHSQGGHAAMFSLHIAGQWAPELHLVGVVAGAPPSQLLFLGQALQASPFRYYELMVAAGFNAAYGDAGAPLDQVLTPLGIQKLSLVDQGCAGTIAAGVQGINFSDLQKADPSTVPVWHDLLAANDPGQFTSASSEPLLIIQGGSDEQIPVISSQILFGQLCTLGQGTQRWIYPGQSHAGVIAPSFNDMLAWISDRFADKSAPSITPTGQSDVQATACASTVPPTTTTTTSAPTTTTTQASTTSTSTTTTSVAPAVVASTTTTSTAALAGSVTPSMVQVLGTQTTRSTLSFTGIDVEDSVTAGLFLLLVGLLVAGRARRPSSSR